MSTAHKEGAPPPLALTGKRCRCSACGEHFNSDSTFSRHRVGDYEREGRNRRCLRTLDLVAKGWSKNAAGFWIERARAPLRAAQSMIAALTGSRPALVGDRA